MSEEKKLANTIMDMMRERERKAYLAGYAKGCQEAIIDLSHESDGGDDVDLGEAIVNDLSNRTDDLFDAFIDYKAYAEGDEKEKSRQEAIEKACLTLSKTVLLVTYLEAKEKRA